MCPVLCTFFSCPFSLFRLQFNFSFCFPFSVNSFFFFLFRYWFSARVLFVFCHITNRSHTSGIVLERLADRVCWTKSQSSLLSIYFSLRGIYSAFLLIHFPYCSNTCLHCQKDWHTTYSIYDDVLSRMHAAQLHSFSETSTCTSTFISQQKLCTVITLTLNSEEKDLKFINK